MVSQTLPLFSASKRTFFPAAGISRSKSGKASLSPYRRGRKMFPADFSRNGRFSPAAGGVLFPVIDGEPGAFFTVGTLEGEF